MTTLTTFAAWPRLVHGRVSFTASCPCGQEATWEQIGHGGHDVYEISCSCPAASTAGVDARPS
jgi:hypothetical protein